MKIPDTPIGPTAPLPGSGSGVLQKASDYADPNAGKELVPKELIEAVKADEERKQTLEVVAAHNDFADAERQMLNQVRQAEGKNALGGLDEPAVYDKAKEWYDKQAQAAIEALPTDRQKLLMTKMVGANRDKGLDSVSLHQAHQQKVYTASVAQGAVEAAAQAAGQKWGDPEGVQVEASKALAAIDALHPGQDTTAQKIKAEAHIYGSVMGQALANGQADNYAYLKTLLFGKQGPTSTSALDSTKQPGMVTPGNIDLSTRPQVKNADGSTSTVRSITIGTDQGTVVIPTVAADGSGILSIQDAISQYKETGQQLGIFKDQASAEKYARDLHEDQAKALSTNQGFADKLDPAARAHYITALREQQKNTTNMRTYATVMAEAGNNPSKALSMFTPAYAEKNGLDGGTWEHVSSLLNGKVGETRAAQAHARAMANEDASKYVLDLYIKHNGVIPPEVAMEAARSGKLRGEMAMRLVEGAAKMTSGIEKDSAQFRMIQASADGTLSPSMVLENASRLGPEQTEHWMKQADPKSPDSGTNKAFSLSIGAAGINFNTNPKNQKEIDENILYMNTRRAFEDRLKLNRGAGAVDARQIADDVVKKGVVENKGFWSSLTGIGGTTEMTRGAAEYLGKPFKYTGDTSLLTPARKQLKDIGLPDDKESGLNYFQAHGEDDLVLRQGVIAVFKEEYPDKKIDPKTFDTLVKVAERKYGRAVLRSKGLMEWQKNK